MYLASQPDEVKRKQQWRSSSKGEGVTCEAILIQGCCI